MTSPKMPDKKKINPARSQIEEWKERKNSERHDDMIGIKLHLTPVYNIEHHDDDCRNKTREKSREKAPAQDHGFVG
jgi:hypothetical protein